MPAPYNQPSSVAKTELDGRNKVSSLSDASLLASGLTLPCGRQVPNRLAKVAMYEHLSPLGGGAPNERHVGLYSAWGAGGWGIIITGNVQVAPDHLGLGGDIVLPELNTAYDLEPWKRLAAAVHACPSGGQRAISLMQLCHTGRQSPRILGGRLPWIPPLAPSAKRVGENVNESLFSQFVYWALFQRPNPMTEQDIDKAINQFLLGVEIAFKAGFDGVQLHGSHGYLITQFLSPKTNLRNDEYSRPLLFLERLSRRVREIVPSHFVLAIKLNAADYVEGGMTEDQSLDHVRMIASWRIFDIIEISGGDYENLEFTNSTSRQAFFSGFSRRASAALEDLPQAPLILLTGSLRGRAALASAIRNNHADLVGLARPSVVMPSLPRFMLDDQLRVEEVPVSFEPKIPKISISKLVGGSIGTMWYCYEMARIASRKGKGYSPSSTSAILRVIYCYLVAIYLRFIKMLHFR